uniref:Adhesion G-protein coupled receptor G1 n=1 Tax=Sphenodon punctatus TaxID=8508 RepID=A0A8D0GQI5_SPHPU
MSELLMMYFVLLALLFQFQGLHGSRENDETFRFCGERNQTQKSCIHYAKWFGNITIENTAEELRIKAPFHGCFTNDSLPNPLGVYRFCIYWHQNSTLLRIQYGKKNYNLSSNASLSGKFPLVKAVPSNTCIPTIFNVSYAYYNKEWKNHSLFNDCAYTLQFLDRPVQAGDIEEELKSLETYLKNPHKGRRKQPVYKQLQGLESKLISLEFEGENMTFGGEVLRASVWKIQPDKSSQNLAISSKAEGNKVVREFEVKLPSIIFAKTKGRRGSTETRVLLLDINSRAIFQDKNTSHVLGEKVIGVSVGNTVVSGLPKNQRVALTFHHDQLPRNMTQLCAFWVEDSSTSESGRWNTSGCETRGEKTKTACLCDHLTFFAVLMVSSPEIDYMHKEYLSILTYVGCIISAMASLFTIGFIFCSRKKHRDHIDTIHIHMNLLWAIFLLDISFLLTEHLASSGNDAACKAGAMFLHFALLCCLIWMGIEGYNLYRLVIEVVNNYVGHFILKLCLVGWGLPAFIVAIIFLKDMGNYGSKNIDVYESSERSTNVSICWITKPLIHNILNLGLLSLLLLFNSVMLGAMIRQILRLQHQGFQCKYALTLLGLSLVLGLPWALAFFSFSTGTFQLVALYLFTIINSLQGFLIFLWYWTMVKARKSSQLQTNSDSVRLQSSTSRTCPE